MNAGIYVRISTDRDEETSTTTQEQRCREYAEAKGWHVAGVYIDRGKSAFNGGRRPEHERLMADVKAGAVNVVIVWKLDRWSRSAAEWYALWDRLQAAKCQWVSVTDSFDTSTRMGKTMIGVVALFAELESGIKSDRIIEWHQHRATRGLKPAAAPIFGYRKTNDGGLAVVPKEAKLVRAAVAHVLGGGSIRGVIREWNGKGVVTRRGNPWTTATFRRTFKSPTLVGGRMVNGTAFVKGTWEPILDLDQWKQLQTLLADPARRISSDNARRMLTGILHCGNCGHPMAANVSRRIPRYQCRAPYEGNDSCGRVSIDGALADEYLRAAVVAVVGDGLPALETHDPAEVNRLEAELAALAADYGNGLITRAEWMAARGGLEHRLGEAVARASRASAAVPANLDAAWPTMNVDQRRAAILAVVERATVAPGYGREGRIKVDWRV